MLNLGFSPNQRGEIVNYGRPEDEKTNDEEGRRRSSTGNEFPISAIEKGEKERREESRRHRIRRIR